MKTDERIDKYLGEAKVDSKKMSKEMAEKIMDAIDNGWDRDIEEEWEGTAAQKHKAFMAALKIVSTKSGWFKDYFTDL